MATAVSKHYLRRARLLCSRIVSGQTHADRGETSPAGCRGADRSSLVIISFFLFFNRDALRQKAAAWLDALIFFDLVYSSSSLWRLFSFSLGSLACRSCGEETSHSHWWEDLTLFFPQRVYLLLMPSSLYFIFSFLLHEYIYLI